MRARSGTLHPKSKGLGGVFVNARDKHKACEIWPRQSGVSTVIMCMMVEMGPV